MSDENTKKQDETRMLAWTIGRPLSEQEVDAVSGGSWTSCFDGGWRLDSPNDALV